MTAPSEATAPIRVGVLVPLSRPGWVDAGRQLLAGFELAASHVKDRGGIRGRPLELLVRDTAADPRKGEAAVDELAELGVAAVAGEYHSVVARAVALRADATGVPFLCSSAVLDALTDQPTDRVARLPPPQSRGWRRYAEFLLGLGHECVGIAAEPSLYWESGTRILRDHLESHHRRVLQFQARELAPEELCTELAEGGATALVLLVGNPELAASFVGKVRSDERLSKMLIGAPAGQPELTDWQARLGADCASIPFLRYLPESLTPLGTSVASALREELQAEPSFVAFEGYDTLATLADIFRSFGTEPSAVSAAWPRVRVAGTRGEITFSRTSGSVWQWEEAPLQIAARDPADLRRFDVLLQF
ncbi:MAG TPA: ABC transporter substrate-binding protein [Candidatus Eisenbacteria bacterium]|nr:ABC transporter substrate-binding protein [Candidatus Eisenbacteria bacterium]